VYSGGGAVGSAIEVGAGGGGFGVAQAAIEKVSPAIATSLRPVLIILLIWLLLAVETWAFQRILAPFARHVLTNLDVRPNRI
jgi:hypothetical protein